MAVFLSAEWIGALDASLRAAFASAGSDLAEPLVVEQHVTDASDHGGEELYHVVLGPGRASAAVGAGPPPDLVLTTDHRTAASIARGEQNAQQALAAGRLRLGGRPERLVAAAAALAALGDVLGGLRAATSFGPIDDAPEG